MKNFIRIINLAAISAMKIAEHATVSNALFLTVDQESMESLIQQGVKIAIIRANNATI